LREKRGVMIYKKKRGKRGIYNREERKGGGINDRERFYREGPVGEQLSAYNLRG